MSVKVVAGPAGKLCPVPLGLRLGPARASVTVEVYIDLVCPYSKKFFVALTTQVLPAFEAKDWPVAWVLHQQVQPWHFQSCIMHEVWAALKCAGCSPTAERLALAAIYEVQEEFMDVAVRDTTKTQLLEKLVDLVAAVDGVDRGLLAEQLEPDVSGGQKNGGCAATGVLKLAVKHGRELSQHGSPECRINGLNANSSSSWGVAEWTEALSSLVEC